MNCCKAASIFLFQLCALFFFSNLAEAQKSQLSLAQRQALKILNQGLKQEEFPTAAQPWEEESIEPYRKLYGQTIYNVFLGQKAARTSHIRPLHDSLQNLGVNGSSITLAMWDEGRIRDNHVENIGRVENRDLNGGYKYHATYVSGVMNAAGVDTAAQGMAYASKLITYSFNSDVGELIELLLQDSVFTSNHSYGDLAGWYRAGGNWYWFGDEQVDSTEDYKFGYYDRKAQLLDRILYHAPKYSYVKAVGNNNRTNIFTPASQPSSHLVLRGGSWVPSVKARDLNAGYDNIPTWATAKNILSIGSVNGRWDGITHPDSISIEKHSSWGPTDDGRVKPDLVADGNKLRVILRNGGYGNQSATSVAAPVVTGLIGLLQEGYQVRHKRNLLNSASIRALLFHTAFDLGKPGPDYKFGWGLVNGEGAGKVLLDDSNQHLMQERSLAQGDSLVLWLPANGSELRTTIAWTDPDAELSTPAVDNRTPKLVNDLDMRISGEGQNYLPYSLDPDHPDSLAQTNKDNAVDNAEQIRIAKPSADSLYRLVVRHKGILKHGHQDFSIVVSGVTKGREIGFAPTGLNPTYEEAAFAEDTLTCSAGRALHIPLHLDAQTDSTTIQLLTSGSAKIGEDYLVQGPVQHFVEAHTDTTVFFQIQLLDDFAKENQESIQLNYQILNPTLGADQDFLDTTILIRMEDDDLPPKAIPGTSLFSETFEAPSGTDNPGWTVLDLEGNSPSTWTTSSSVNLSGSKSAYVAPVNNLGQHEYDTGAISEVIFISPEIDAQGLERLKLSFRYQMGGDSSNAFGQLFYTLDNNNFSTITGQIIGQGQVLDTLLTLPPAIENKRFRLAWYWKNDSTGNFQPPWAIDSIQVWSETPLFSYSDTMTLQAQVMDSSLQVVHARDSFMMAYESLPQFDFGCVQHSLSSRADTGRYFAHSNSFLFNRIFRIETSQDSSYARRMSLYAPRMAYQSYLFLNGLQDTASQLVVSEQPLDSLQPSRPYINGPQGIKTYPLDSLSYYSHMTALHFTVQGPLEGYYALGHPKWDSVGLSLSQLDSACEGGQLTMSVSSPFDTGQFLWYRNDTLNPVYSSSNVQDSSYTFSNVQASEDFYVRFATGDGQGPVVPLPALIAVDSLSIHTSSSLFCSEDAPRLMEVNLPYDNLWLNKALFMDDTIRKGDLQDGSNSIIAVKDTFGCTWSDTLTIDYYPLVKRSIQQNDSSYFVDNLPNTDSLVWLQAQAKIGKGDSLLLKSQSDTGELVFEAYYLGCKVVYSDTLLIVSTAKNWAKEKRISIYPNPSHQRLWIEHHDKEAYTLLVWSPTGTQKTLEIQAHQVRKSVDVSTWPSGLYLFRIQNKSGGWQGQQKIIIQH